MNTPDPNKPGKFQEREQTMPEFEFTVTISGSIFVPNQQIANVVISNAVNLNLQILEVNPMIDIQVKPKAGLVIATHLPQTPA